MKILRLSKTPLPEKALTAFADFGMPVTELSPALLSAMTSLKVSKALGNADYGVVMVDSMDNAMAAISARKLNTKAPFSLAYYVKPDSEVPKSVHKDIRAGVDGWLFPSHSLCDAYPSELKDKTVMPPVSLAGIKVERESHAVPVITWIGPIIHAHLLKEAIEEVEAQQGRFMLRIAGAGQAKTVMPLVRLARALQNGANVEWTGESYDIARELAKCSAVLRTAPDITTTETIALQNGITLIRPADIATFLNGRFTATDVDFDPSAEGYLSALRTKLLHIIQQTDNKQ